MTKAKWGLISQEGDRLGHLVRGIQMLRSYGHECEIEGYSDVVNVERGAGHQPLLCCVLSGRTEATLESLTGICRETHWALGDETEILRVAVMEYANQKTAKPADQWLYEVAGGRLGKGMSVFLPADDFKKICDWGQQLTDADAPVIGEWPSATGR